MQVYVSTTGDDSTGDGSQAFPWKSLRVAFDRLRLRYFLSEDVTIRLLDGEYDCGALPAIGNHPNGWRISVVGNADAPGDCALTWDAATSGIVLSHGNSLRLIQGLTLIGQGNSTVPPFTFSDEPGINPDTAGDAVACYYASSVELKNIVARKWLHGLTAWGSSSLNASDCEAYDCWDSGFFAYQSSSLHCTDCQADDNSDGDTLGYGFLAEMSSSAFLQGCSATGNRIGGAYANKSSNLVLRDCDFDGNLGHGSNGWDGANVILRSATAEIDKLTACSSANGLGMLLCEGSAARLHGAASNTLLNSNVRAVNVFDSQLMGDFTGNSNTYSGLWAYGGGAVARCPNVVLKNNGFEPIMAGNGARVWADGNRVISGNGSEKSADSLSIIYGG